VRGPGPVRTPVTGQARRAAPRADRIGGRTRWKPNTRTGIALNLSAGVPDHVFEWTVDRLGEPRFVVTEFEGKQALYWKAKASTGWTKIHEAPSAVGVIGPVYVESETRVYAVAHVEPNSDVASLVAMITCSAQPLVRCGSQRVS